MKFIFHLANKIHERWKNIRTIEMVAGSCISGFSSVHPLDRPSDTGVLARREAAIDVFNRLRRSLFDVLRSDGLGNQLLNNGISLSFELEPGPLFALRDWATLIDFCSTIDQYGDYSKLIGINVDIAHWRLAGIGEHLSELHPGNIVFDRISHAHISGHHRCAHFGDLRINALNSAEEFRPWIEFISRVATAARSRPPFFSGILAHEFEAAFSTDCVRESLVALQAIV